MIISSYPSIWPFIVCSKLKSKNSKIKWICDFRDICGRHEYMMSQKPIVYVVNGNIPHSFPSKYMERLGGVCYEASRHEETYPDLKAYILSKYREWEETGNVTVVQDREYIEKYSYKVIAEQVWEILNNL